MVASQLKLAVDSNETTPIPDAGTRRTSVVPFLNGKGGGTAVQGASAPQLCMRTQPYTETVWQRRREFSTSVG